MCSLTNIGAADSPNSCANLSEWGPLEPHAGRIAFLLGAPRLWGNGSFAAS